MGSASDLPVMQAAIDTLESFGIEVDKRVISAHRAAHALMEWAESAEERGLSVIIAGAGGAAHLAGVIAGLTHLPVIGVPVRSKTLDGLDREAMIRILKEPKNALTKQYKKLLAMDNITLSFDDDALDYIVDKALEYKLGARGLRGLMEAVMMDIMYELPNHKRVGTVPQTFTVTKAFAQEKLEKADLYRLKNAV